MSEHVGFLECFRRGRKRGPEGGQVAASTYPDALAQQDVAGTEAASEARQSTQDPERPEGLSDEDYELLDKLAKKVVHWRMSVPAIVLLESSKPLSFLGSQLMVFLSPIVNSVVSIADYDRFTAMMEKRPNWEFLIRRIEILEEEQKEAERRARRRH